jgi:phospholipid-binding lipoprotein MlaA
VLLLLAACGPAPVPSGIDDPYEAQNREVHRANQDIDRALFGPAAGAYGGILPAPVKAGISNLSDNLDLPGDVVNNILQLRLGRAAQNTLRFVVNTTVGLGGLLDPATDFGIPARETDFGETLYVWGVPEGAYVELPVLGPSTERDTLGRVVDVALNPLRWVVKTPTEEGLITATGIAAKLGSRERYADLIDSVLEGADSYSQTRLLYLQNRRFELTGGLSEEDYFDPYSDTEDEYADPYAQ